MGLRDDLLAQESALQAAIVVDAHATVAAAKQLFDFAEDEEYHRFRDCGLSDCPWVDGLSYCRGGGQRGFCPPDRR